MRNPIWSRLFLSTFSPSVFPSLELCPWLPLFFPVCTFFALLFLPPYPSPVIPGSPLSSIGQAGSEARLAEPGILQGLPGWAWMERQKGPWLNWHMHHRVCVTAPLCQTLYPSNLTNSSERRKLVKGDREKAWEAIIDQQSSQINNHLDPWKVLSLCSSQGDLAECWVCGIVSRLFIIFYTYSLLYPPHIGHHSFSSL